MYAHTKNTRTYFTLKIQAAVLKDQNKKNLSKVSVSSVSRCS